MSGRLAYEINRLRKTHASGFSLVIDSLNIIRGEVVSLLGPTGSGKSTLLRLLALLEEDYDGQVQFHDPASKATPLTRTRQIALVHQRPMLLARSVRQNVEYGLKVRGLHQPELVMQTLESCGLASYSRQAARTLSAGQTQLVALARALVLQPAVLLLDEPTANLDPAHVARVEELVADYRTKRQATVVWATHNLFQARRVADRTALLLGGRLVEIADRDTFFDRPADPRTVAFTQGKMVY